MDINTEITHNSWGSMSPQKAQNYLHYYPRQMKVAMSKFISSISPQPRVLDIGCGNAQIYPILKQHNPNLQYTGVDITESLVNVAKGVVGDGGTIIKDDIFKYVSNTTERFDVLILSHMLECIESPDLIMTKAAQISDYIAIHWFDTPKYDYDIVTIAHNPHSEDTFKPYLRRKMGRDYWQYLINKNNLVLVHREASEENNVLEVYKRK